VVIMTHDHAEDFALCDAALRLGQPLGSIGLIGSSVKWTRFQAQLAELGHGPAAIALITCPIGRPGITGKDPAIIAVAVAAGLLENLPASQRAPAATGLTSDEGARREGAVSRAPGGERESRVTT
jgi:xanthine dehydrogenase accessory factor